MREMVSLKVSTVRFLPGERNVFFHILTHCNLHCRHCYVNPEQHGEKILDRQTIISWLQLFSDPTKKTNLVFLGGEPTLHRDLAWCIQEAKGMGFSVTVDTNGFLFHDLLERSSPDLLDQLNFSLDGPDSTVNDALRGEGVFAICTENIRKAKTMGFRVAVITTVSSGNITHLSRMIPLLSELEVDHFFIQVVGLRGHAVREKGGGIMEAGAVGQVEAERWLATVPQVALQAAEAGIYVTYPAVYLDADESFVCAGRVAENYFIFPNGRVYLCPLGEDYPLHSYAITENRLCAHQGITEKQLFSLDIAEGCVMNKLLQPGTLSYDEKGKPLQRISCCLLKRQLAAASPPRGKV